MDLLLYAFAMAEQNNTDPELDGIFIAQGAGIRRGVKLDRVRNLDVAPTIARLLDVALRSGPYGDKFSRKAEGLTLAKVMAANPAGGIDLGPLQPRIPEVLRTPSGQVELAPPTLLADMARAVADLARPAPDLVVIGRRDVRTNNSWMHNLPTLAKGPFRCTALVHPDDARRAGLVDGARATLRHDGRELQVQVELSDSMMPGAMALTVTPRLANSRASALV